MSISDKKSNWQHDIPDWDEPIFAVVETESGPEYFIGKIDNHMELIDLDYCQPYGWSFESIDRWCSMKTVLSLIEGINYPLEGLREDT